jgi:hypothetical protein
MYFCAWRSDKEQCSFNHGNHSLLQKLFRLDKPLADDDGLIERRLRCGV